MEKHELDLLGNAVDSFDEALCKYQQGLDEDPKAFKFCILHLAHFFELILKHYVSLSHPLLIYKNPFKKNLDPDEALTITFDDAVSFLKNEGADIPKTFEADLKWLKDLRNKIVHHEFVMDIEDVKSAIGRLILAFHQFDDAHESINLGQHIDAENSDLFDELAQTYKAKVRAALSAVEAAETEAYRGLRPKEYADSPFRIYHCPECGLETMVPHDDSHSGFRCTLCGNEDSMLIEHRCGNCDQEWTMDDLRYGDYYGEGVSIYYCPRCAGDPEYHPD